jgi:hypothetical protein
MLHLRNEMDQNGRETLELKSSVPKDSRVAFGCWVLLLIIFGAFLIVMSRYLEGWGIAICLAFCIMILMMGYSGLNDELKIILNNEGVRFIIYNEEFYRWKDIEYFVVEERHGEWSSTDLVLHFHDGKTAEFEIDFTGMTSKELSSLFQAYLSRYHG